MVLTSTFEALSTSNDEHETKHTLHILAAQRLMFIRYNKY